MKEASGSINSIIKAMGLVFGDIGTSPIYTFTVIFLTLDTTVQNIKSVLSLILWTLLLVVSVQYAWFAMSLSKRGEGGTIVLNEILKKLLKSSREIIFFSFLTYLGISLLIGDSVITPAISILSAVEGLSLVKSFSHISQSIIILITLGITIFLFSIQKKGTEKITNIFGPIMFVWFIFLGVSGIWQIVGHFEVLSAFNPLYALNFLFHNGICGFFILSEVILCATGAEALYADMGHLGRKPIVYAWIFVCVMLIANYLGQGVFLINNPQTKNILFSMILSQTKLFYFPFLFVSILATIIASQAMISGLFSIVYQGINSRIFPLLKVDNTSERIESQIYIGAVNWFLLFFVIVMILFFKKSENLAAAYGFAVAGTMTITGIFISTIFYIKKMYLKFSIGVILTIIDICFFLATCIKIPHGAYWSIIISSIPLAIIILYVYGNKKLYNSMATLKKDVFLSKYNKIYPNVRKIKGCAIYFARGLDNVPQYIIQTMFVDLIFYEDNIFVQIIKKSEPFGIEYRLVEVSQGLRVLNINIGYMQKFKIEDILKDLKIKEKVIFYGVEDMQTNNIFWKIFRIMKKITPSFVDYYHLPAHKVRGIITKIVVK